MLDKQNLASIESLEALNRLLDDNRESILCRSKSDCQTRIQILVYLLRRIYPVCTAGRKSLSRAFRNRFVELHVYDIPGNDMVQIIRKRCSLSASSNQYHARYHAQKKHKKCFSSQLLHFRPYHYLPIQYALQPLPQHQHQLQPTLQHQHQLMR
jgi:hypothetical protein